jgi:hypothetical protein
MATKQIRVRRGENPIFVRLEDMALFFLAFGKLHLNFDLNTVRSRDLGCTAEID